MKLSVLSLILVALLCQGCATNNASSSTQDANKQNPKKGADWSNIKPAPPKNEDSTRAGKPAADGKSVEKLYEHLTAKGWKFTEPKQNPYREFDSEESYSFRNEDKVGFLAMRYDDAGKANQNFPRIEEIYQKKFGRALKSKNFIVAVFGNWAGINKPQLMSLNENEAARLQADLDEFTKS